MTPSAAVAEPRDEEAGGGGEKGGKIRAGVDAHEEPRPPTSNTERSSAPRFRRKTIRDSEVLLQSGTTQHSLTRQNKKRAQKLKRTCSVSSDSTSFLHHAYIPTFPFSKMFHFISCFLIKINMFYTPNCVSSTEISQPGARFTSKLQESRQTRRFKLFPKALLDSPA